MRSSRLLRLLPLPLVGLLLVMSSSPLSSRRAAASGVEGNNDSEYDSMGVSGDGRYVAFGSMASNLVPNDSNNMQDIFVRDRQTGATTRVSVDASSGGDADSASLHPGISSDGRYVVFATNATDLVAGRADRGIVVYDMVMKTAELVSVNDAGEAANGATWNITEPPSVSEDGNFVAFWSSATNLVANDTKGKQDIFVRDRGAQTTTRVSVASGGTEANNNSYYPSISADGCHVAFTSSATNLVPDDTDTTLDVFVHDCDTNTTMLVSVNNDGVKGNGTSQFESISGDGQYVAFATNASNITGDASGAYYVVVYDRVAKSVQVAGSGTKPTISADGRYVAFESGASNLVPDDTNGVNDIFVYDGENGQIVRVSVDSSGVQGNGASHSILPPAISGDGQHVAFYSVASNLVPYDTNGFSDAFVHDMQTGETELVSQATAGLGPDLIVEDMFSDQTMGNYCTTPAGFSIAVKNIGTDSAGPSVTMVAGGMMGTIYIDTPAAAPGQTVYAGGNVGMGGHLTGTANWNHAVGESDYTNNSLTKDVGVITLPTCTVTPSPTATFTATATATPTATLDPVSVGGIAEPPEDFGGTHGGSGLPMGAIAMLAAAIGFGVLLAGGWYARRRLGRR